jgi:hypothetical protein
VSLKNRLFKQLGVISILAHRLISLTIYPPDAESPEMIACSCQRFLSHIVLGISTPPSEMRE